MLGDRFRPNKSTLSLWAKRARRDEGVTLVEILVVLAIIALIGSIAGPRVIGYLGDAKSKSAQLQVSALVSAIELYGLENGTHPSQVDGLRALIAAPINARNWRGPYLKKVDGLVDPWGRPYHYRIPGSHGEFDIFSLGRDNIEGGSGEDKDVKSW